MERIRRRIFDALELTPDDDLPSRLIGAGIMLLIVLNTVALMLETVDSLASFDSAFQTLEWISVGVFTVEYLLRIWTCTADPVYRGVIRGRLRYLLTPMALIDLAAILPAYLPMFISLDLRFIRLLRMFRLFRLFKMARYSDSIRTIGQVLRLKREELVVTTVVVLILIVFASSLLYATENEAQPEAFSSIPKAMWWAAITLTSVGYGDIYPITPLGRLMGSVIAILGIGLVAMPAGVFASGFAEVLQQTRDDRRKKQPSGVCPHCGKEL
jgi:voltage-gated potassium channel